MTDPGCEQGALAVVLVDVISDFEIPDGDVLFEPAQAVTPHILRLKERAKAAAVPCIYANDNFGRWRSDFRAHIERCTRQGVRGAPIARALAPQVDDYFVLKPKHSAFYETCLRTLLEHLGVRRLVIAGFSTDMCVYMTAADAYLRGYELIVPVDTTAALSSEARDGALALMQRALHAQTPKLGELDFASEHAQRDSGRDLEHRSG